MPVTIACPNCDARLEAPDDIKGKKVQCKKCGEKFRARPVEEGDEDDRPARRAAGSASKSRPRLAPDNEDEDGRSARRTGKASRRREEDDEDDRDDDDRPRRRSRDEGDEEGEPRPRRKKGKKKKALSPVVLWGLIGVGVLILIAGIGAYFSSGDKSDGATAAGGPVSGPGGGPGAGGGAPPDSAVPGWVEFADPNGQYTVRLPRTPAAPTKQQWPLPGGDPAEATIYTVEIGGGLYAVAHLTVPGREAGAPADPVLDDAITGQVGWFRGAVVKSRTNIKHQGFAGRQAVLEYPGVKGSTVLRVILAGNRMFWLVAKGDNFTADTPKVRGFFDSLKIN